MCKEIALLLEESGRKGKVMRSHFLRYTLVVPVLLFLLMFTAGTAGASSVSRHSTTVNPRLGVVAHHYVTKHLQVSHAKISTSGTHYLYVDDGTCADAIDAYAVTSTVTHINNYPTNGCLTLAYYGASVLAVARATSAHGNCLIYGSTNDSTFLGFMTSFPINSDGSLGTQTSEVETSTGAVPGAIAVSSNGNFALDSNPGNDIESYSIGNGCALTFAGSVSTSSVFNMATAGSYVVSADTNASDIDTYLLSSTGSLSSVGSSNGNVTNVDGVALHKTAKGWVLYTGQATANAPEAQAGRYTQSNGAFTNFTGSPATDSQGLNGALVTTTPYFLIMGEQYTSSLANFSVMHQTASFSSHVSMAVSGTAPDAFATDGKTLFVDGLYFGDIEGCSLSSTSGASNCATVATLANNTGISAGMALL
jgi:hypothetical protein